MLSSVLGAVGSIKQIRSANFQSIFFIIAILLIGYNSLVTINAVALLILLIWASRAIVWYYSAMKQLKST